MGFFCLLLFLCFFLWGLFFKGVWSCLYEVQRMLIEKKVFVHTRVRNKDGISRLDVACKHGHQIIVKYLLKIRLTCIYLVKIELAFYY